jgi:hypothetical protein
MCNIYGHNGRYGHNGHYGHNGLCGLREGELIKRMEVLEISGNLIANNTSTGLTGGISMTNGFPFVHNNIIVNNTAGTAGAFSIKQNSAPVITNNTIYGNTGVNGAFLLFNSHPTLVNCIIASEGNVFAIIASTATVSYSCLSGGYAGEGNIDEDPLFVSPTEGYGSGYDGLTADWHLAEGSPCIDAGNPGEAYNDLDGSRNDMGAYGWNGFPDYGITESDENEINPVMIQMLAYPNPFNPQINILFTLREPEIVTMEIYNTKGQLIDQKDAGQYPPGQYQISWNAEKFASGVYFIRLKCGAGNLFRKVVLMK